LGAGLPVAVVGHSVGGLELYHTLDDLGLTVVLDEWGEFAACLSLSGDTAGFLALSPMAAGVQARLQSLQTSFAQVAGVIVLSEPFCAHSLLETAVRQCCGVPVLGLSCETLRPLDQARRMRIESFARSLREGEGRSWNSESRIQNPEGRIQNPEFRIQNSESGIQNPEGRIQNPEFRIQNSESGIQNPEGRIQNPESGRQKAEAGSRLESHTLFTPNMAPPETKNETPSTECKKNRIGLFSTIPVEIIFAAGAVPVDVNNLFVTHVNPGRLLEIAHEHGFPNTVCAWTRGLFGAVMEEGISQVVVVPHGDCSMNLAMADRLEAAGVRVYRFHYPLEALDPVSALREEISRLAKELGTDLKAARRIFDEFRPLRQTLRDLDHGLWTADNVPAEQVRVAQLSATDFLGDAEVFKQRLTSVGSTIDHRPSYSALPTSPAGLRRTSRATKDKSTINHPLRVALFGVPGLLSDLVPYLEELGARVVLFETEHAFAMLSDGDSLEEQYSPQGYSYPYGIEVRLKRFLELCRQRSVDRVVYYQQAFCHHNLETRRVLAALAPLPVLALEGDVPGMLTQRDRLRLETFVMAHSVGRSSPILLRPSGYEGQVDHRACLALDLGSRFAKILLVTGDRQIRHRMDSMEFYRAHTRRVDGHMLLDVDGIAALMGSSVTPASIVATGYGRHLARVEGALVLPEIIAHALGAAYQVSVPEFLLVDFGGQDTKAIHVSRGTVAGFVANDKCAAGSGRYVENMARVLGMSLDDVLCCSADPVPLSQVCATFGESEVVGHIVDGVSERSIAAGVMQSVAQRTLQLLGSLSGRGGRSVRTLTARPEPATTDGRLPLYLSGGLGSASALTEFLLASGRFSSVQPLPDVQFNGAIGCLRSCSCIADPSGYNGAAR
jgi:predicted CoA-substrate-specific enzyme activase